MLASEVSVEVLKRERVDVVSIDVMFSAGPTLEATVCSCGRNVGLATGTFGDNPTLWIVPCAFNHMPRDRPAFRDRSS